MRRRCSRAPSRPPPGRSTAATGPGPHPCGGDAPTAGTALADTGVPWSGRWERDFGDFFVERIGPDDSRPPASYWSVLVNGRYARGACRERLDAWDEVLWANGTAARPRILALTRLVDAAGAREPVERGRNRLRFRVGRRRTIR